LRNLFTLYTDTKREIKAGSYSVTRKWKEIPLTDVASVLSTQYNQSAQEYLTSAIVAQLSPSLLKYYQQEKAKYWESLRKM
jgi:hypothetical protein